MLEQSTAIKSYVELQDGSLVDEDHLTETIKLAEDVIDLAKAVVERA